MDAMWAYFSHNMEVVNFWLASCVLPTETKQYPSRLTATAWHLAERPSKGQGLAGFSGTNDNHWLLPSQVQQVPLYDAPELQGTNGKMLDMLLRHGRYETLLLPRDNTQVRVHMCSWHLQCVPFAMIKCHAARLAVVTVCELHTVGLLSSCAHTSSVTQSQ
jgi:hypothetical protein